MNKTKLLEICESRGLEGVSSGMIKADIITAILSAQEERENADA